MKILNIFSSLKGLFNIKIPVFHQESKGKIVWDLFMLMVVFWSSLSIPYRMLEGSDHFDFSYWFITVVFCFDILITFNSTAKIQSKILTDRRSISKQYLKTWMVPDFLAAFPFPPVALLLMGKGIAGGLAFNILMALRLLRLLKLFKAHGIFLSLQELLNINPSLMRLIVFAFWFTIAAHYMSLGWIFIGAGDQTGTFSIKYIRALYWCITTIATIGYGDITPDRNSARQMVYTVIVQLIGVGMFGYIIGNIATLIANLDTAKAEFRKKMEEIKEHMRLKKIPKELQDKVRHYYNFLWETQRSTKKANVLADLPHTLSIDISLFLNRIILEKVSLFKNSDEVFIREVVRLLEPQVFLPEDFIIRQGEFGDSMYFVNSGEVEVIVNSNVVAKLGPGSFFGETALIQGEKRTASIKTLTYCDVYILSKQNFDGLRSKYPDFDKKVNEIMEQRIKATKEKTSGR